MKVHNEQKMKGSSSDNWQRPVQNKKKTLPKRSSNKHSLPFRMKHKNVRLEYPSPSYTAINSAGNNNKRIKNI